MAQEHIAMKKADEVRTFSVEDKVSKPGRFCL